VTIAEAPAYGRGAGRVDLATMPHISNGIAVAAALMMLQAGAAGTAGPPSGPLTKCLVDAVVSGSTCMDKYEASVWRVPNPTTVNAPVPFPVCG
jgi:hypothetical protein